MQNLSMSLLAILDEIPLGICLISTDLEVLFVNRTLEALTGFSRQECRGLPCSHIIRFNNCFESCPINKIDEQEKFVLEGDIINQEHQKIPVRVSFAALRNGTGKISGYIEAIDDLRRVRNFDPANMLSFSLGQMVGRSPEMEKIFQFLPVIAQSDAPVLITGETGTGKDLLAEAIHHASARSKNSFISFRCGALPDFLVESELFGHEKGAFPGATENKRGKFRLAQNGTIYLAEAGDLPLPLQAKLLNYLDEKIIYPMGSTKSFQVNARIIVASSRSLDDMVREGRFRKELYYRLNAVSLHLPPLKERGGDVRLLMDHFLRTRASLLKKSISGFSRECLHILEDYSYPGNILELKHVVEYAVNLCQGEYIEENDLPAYLTSGLNQLSPKPPVDEGLSLPDQAGGDQSLDWAAIERKMIVDALLKVNGRRSRAAQLLGWGRSTLWRKMKLYGIASSEDTMDSGR
jgi:two-component system, NtrC family, response regulator AtoC